MNIRNGSGVIFVLSLVLILVSVYLTYVHYTEKAVPCPLLKTQDCNVVLSSSYSTLFGVPVSLLGFFLYVALAYNAYRIFSLSEHYDRKYGKRLLYISSIGIIGAGYFNSVMLFKLNALCTWCEFTHIMIAIIFILSLVMFSPLKFGKKVALFAGLFIIGSLFSFIPVAETHDALAQCLTEKRVMMYGAYWCSHCADQKRMFGTSFKDVLYVECAIPGLDTQTPECERQQIQGYPTWIRTDGERLSGVIPLSQLASWAGCDEELNKP